MPGSIAQSTSQPLNLLIRALSLLCYPADAMLYRLSPAARDRHASVLQQPDILRHHARLPRRPPASMSPTCSCSIQQAPCFCPSLRYAAVGLCSRQARLTKPYSFCTVCRGTAPAPGVSTSPVIVTHYTPTPQPPLFTPHTHCHTAPATGEFVGQKLPVQGVDSDALDTLIESFYTGECPLTLRSAPSVYDAAVKLEVRYLPPSPLPPGRHTSRPLPATQLPWRVKRCRCAHRPPKYQSNTQP